MEKGDYWIKFEWRVWRTDPALRKLSPESRSWWMDLLCDMSEARTYFVKGTPQDLANSLGIPVEKFEIFVADLKRTDTGDVRRSNGIVTIVSRRRKREYKTLESTRLRVAKHREKRPSNGDVTPEKRDRVRIRVRNKNKDLSIQSSKKDLEFKDSGVESPPQEKTAAPTKRGTRIPQPFLLTKAMRSWAVEKCPNIDLVLETEKFTNHFRAKTGKDATALDWEARWRNWMLNARDRYGANRNGSVITNSPMNGQKPEWQINIENCKKCDDRGYLITNEGATVCKHSK